MTEKDYKICPRVAEELIKRVQKQKSEMHLKDWEEQKDPQPDNVDV